MDLNLFNMLFVTDPYGNVMGNHYPSCPQLVAGVPVCPILFQFWCEDILKLRPLQVYYTKQSPPASEGHAETVESICDGNEQCENTLFSPPGRVKTLCFHSCFHPTRSVFTSRGVKTLCFHPRGWNTLRFHPSGGWKHPLARTLRIVWRIRSPFVWICRTGK